MASKNPAREKRAKLPRRSDYTRQFAKDWARLSASGRYDLRRAKEGMTLVIADSGPLPQEWLDHPLHGQWADHREFHAGGDFLVIYRLASDDSVLFVRIGTHSELFDS